MNNSGGSTTAPSRRAELLLAERPFFAFIALAIKTASLIQLAVKVARVVKVARTVRKVAKPFKSWM